MNMQQHLSYLVKPASFDCNLFCDYCFYRKTAEEYPEESRHRMDEETLETLVRKAQEYSSRAVAYMWQGGEPTLMGLDFYKRAIEIQQRHTKPGQTVSNTLQTNGILIDDDWARFLAENHFLVGLSLDGPQEQYDTHRFDRARRSVFDKVLRAADIMTAHDVEFNILAVVNNDTAHYPVEIYRYLVERGYHFLQFIECIEVADGELAPFSVEPKLFGEFLCKLFDEWFENGYPYVNIRLFDNFLQYHVGMTPECCMYKDECGSYFVVEHNGDIFPCDFFVSHDWKLGNIHENSIQDFIDHPKHLEFAASRSIPHEACESCEWLGFCLRGCIRSRYLPELDYAALSHYCESYRMFFEHTRDRYRFLAQDIMRRRRGLPAPPEPGRNDPCFCGSGRKYKKCCEKYAHIMKK